MRNDLPIIGLVPLLLEEMFSVFRHSSKDCLRGEGNLVLGQACAGRLHLLYLAQKLLVFYCQLFLAAVRLVQTPNKSIWHKKAN